MKYLKDKEYNLKYATTDGATKEIKLVPEKDMNTPEVITKLKNNNKDFFKLLENKKSKITLEDIAQKANELGYEVLYDYRDDFNTILIYKSDSVPEEDYFDDNDNRELYNYLSLIPAVEYQIDDDDSSCLAVWLQNLKESAELNTGDDSIASNTGFYIGDPCYVLPDEIYYGIWDEQYNFEDGKINVKDGLAFLVHGTAYGDGEYFDEIGTSYGVDSGTLAVIPFELIKKPEIMPSEGDYEYGRFVAGTNATLEYVDGIFTFKVNEKEIVIDTDPAYDDYEYEDEDDTYEEDEE